MKNKILTFILSLFSVLGFAQEKYKFQDEIKTSTDNIKKVETLVQQEFGAASSPGIWTSNSSNYGLMIRTKGDTFTIRAWQVSDNTEIKDKIARLMDKVKSIL